MGSTRSANEYLCGAKRTLSPGPSSIYQPLCSHLLLTLTPFFLLYNTTQSNQLGTLASLESSRSNPCVPLNNPGPNYANDHSAYIAMSTAISPDVLLVVLVASFLYLWYSRRSQKVRRPIPSRSLALTIKPDKFWCNKQVSVVGFVPMFCLTVV